jgi:hypothetical protein
MMNRMRHLGAITFAICCVGSAAPSSASAQVSFGIGISIGTPPPPLPVYEQPVVIGPDYIWTPGYWGWNNAAYAWHRGYWGNRIGYYGGINYGFGYFGRGYVGGGWSGGHFRYNTAVTNVNTTIVHNVYVNKTVMVNNNTTVTQVSYNGGHGGVVARPTSSELAVGRRVPMTSIQMQHERISAQDRNQLASVNHNRPHQLAVSRPFTAQSHHITAAQRIQPQDHVAQPARGTRTPPKQGQRRSPSVAPLVKKQPPPKRQLPKESPPKA